MAAICDDDKGVTKCDTPGAAIRDTDTDGKLNNETLFCLTSIIRKHIIINTKALRWFLAVSPYKCIEVIAALVREPAVTSYLPE